MAARAGPTVVCQHCSGPMHARTVQHGAAVQYYCPRCHIIVRLPSDLALAAAPFVVPAST